MEEPIFRKKSLERISSPEQLHDYMRVTNPSVWLILAAVIVLLAGLLVGSAIGTIEQSVSIAWSVKDGEAVAEIFSAQAGAVRIGMPVRVNGLKCTVESIGESNGDFTAVTAHVSLPDGVYDGEIITEVIHPIEFLWNHSRQEAD